MGLQAHIHKRMLLAVDHFNALSFASSSVMQWGITASYICSMLILGCSAGVIVAGAVDKNVGPLAGNNSSSSSSSISGDNQWFSLSPELAAVALSYCFAFPYYAFWFVHDGALFLQDLTCLERVLEYRNLQEQEPEWHLIDAENRRLGVAGMRTSQRMR